MNAGLEIEYKIQDALEIRDPDDLISRVKSIVASELKELSPIAAIEYTSYYNHTYIPDMIVTWQRGGVTRERQVFVRQRLRAGSLRRDLSALADRDPVVLGLLPAIDESNTVSAAMVQSSLPQGSQTLVADARAIAAMNDPWDWTAEASGHGVSDPLMALVRENVLDGGRGFLGVAQAAAITSGEMFSTGGDVERPDETFDSAIGEIFSADAVARIQRAVELLQWGVQGNSARQIFGSLSEAELRIIVPYLLRYRGVTDSPAFWGYLASLMTLSDLEGLDSELSGVNVSRLVQAGANHWAAKRVQLTLDANYDNDPAAGWTVVNKVLVGRVGGWRAAVTTDSRRLKGRVANPPARWGEVRPALGRAILQAVELRGASRNITASAAESQNVTGDVDRILESIDDVFHVTDLSVKSPSALEEAVVDLSFLEMTATSRGHESVQNLTDLAVGILGHRRPTDISPLLVRQGNVGLAMDD